MRLIGLTFSFIFVLMVQHSTAVRQYDPICINDTVQQKDDSKTIKPKKTYDQRVSDFNKKWTGLIPKQFVVQYAGNMGLVSLGTGWNYGKNKKGHKQWETQLFFGLIPKYQSNRVKVTTTLKQNYIPWSINLNHNFNIEPFRTGLYVNTVFGHEFWEHQPSRYPKKYYDFLSTKFRFNVFAGGGITKVIPRNNRKFVKSITAFYEVSTCDLYIRSMYIDHSIKLKDILGLSLGVKFQLL